MRRVHYVPPDQSCGQVSLINQPTQPIHKGLAFLLILQKHKGWSLFADIAFVQNDSIVAKVGALEHLHPRHYDVRELSLLEDTEIQHKNRVVPVDGPGAVVAGSWFRVSPRRLKKRVC